MIERNNIYCGDCLELMKSIPDGSVDMILCDLPYGTTASEWDKNIAFGPLWEQYERIISDSGAIVLFASGMFAYKLIQSNERLYKYKWIWVKSRKGNFVNAKNRPMTSFEEILVFSKGNTANGSKVKMNYFPQGLEVCGKMMRNGDSKFGTMAGKRASHKKETIREFSGYPCDVLMFPSEPKPLHPTQKPLDLCEYLVKTYTHEGDLVLDNCIGSGTTAIACVNTGRDFIGMDLSEEYCNFARKRIDELFED